MFHHPGNRPAELLQLMLWTTTFNSANTRYRHHNKQLPSRTQLSRLTSHEEFDNSRLDSELYVLQTLKTSIKNQKRASALRLLHHFCGSAKTTREIPPAHTRLARAWADKSRIPKSRVCAFVSLAAVRGACGETHTRHNGEERCCCPAHQVLQDGSERG